MSGGRVELGLGAGWFEAEHRAYGHPVPRAGERFDRLEEQLEIITGLWATPVGRDVLVRRQHYKVVDSPALPKPVQPPRPPIIVGGTGKRRTPRLAARSRTSSTSPSPSVDGVGAQFDRVREACEAVGRDPDTLVYSAAQTVCCGRDDAEVRRRAEAIGRDLDELRDHGVGGTPGRDRREASAGSPRPAPTRVYLQMLDLADLDHLDLIAAEVKPRSDTPAPPRPRPRSPLPPRGQLRPLKAAIQKLALRSWPLGDRRLAGSGPWVRSPSGRPASGRNLASDSASLGGRVGAGDDPAARRRAGSRVGRRRRTGRSAARCPTRRRRTASIQPTGPAYRPRSIPSSSAMSGDGGRGRRAADRRPTGAGPRPGPARCAWSAATPVTSVARCMTLQVQDERRLGHVHRRSSAARAPPRPSGPRTRAPRGPCWSGRGTRPARGRGRRRRCAGSCRRAPAR